MVSQAQVLTASQMLARMARHGGFLPDPTNRVHRYASALDMQIRDTEDAIAQQRGRAGALLISAHLRKDKGDIDGMRRNVGTVKEIRRDLRALADRLDALVAKRDAANLQAAE